MFQKRVCVSQISCDPRWAKWSSSLVFWSLLREDRNLCARGLRGSRQLSSCRAMPRSLITSPPARTDCLYSFNIYSCREPTKLFLASGRTCACPGGARAGTPGESARGVLLRAGLFSRSDYGWLSPRPSGGCAWDPALCRCSAGRSAELGPQAGNEGAGRGLCDSARGRRLLPAAPWGWLSEGPDWQLWAAVCSTLPVPGRRAPGSGRRLEDWGGGLGGCSDQRGGGGWPGTQRWFRPLQASLRPCSRRAGCVWGCPWGGPGAGEGLWGGRLRAHRCCVGLSRAEHKKHSPGCAFLALKKACEELTLGEFLKLDKERAKNKIVRTLCRKGPERAPRGVCNPDLPSPSFTRVSDDTQLRVCGHGRAWACPRERCLRREPREGHPAELALGKRRWSPWNLRGLLQGAGSQGDWEIRERSSAPRAAEGRVAGEIPGA